MRLHVFAITLVGALGSPSVAWTQAVEGGRLSTMTINLDTMQVTTPHWSSNLIDCSDEAVECVEAPGYFLLSMQRQCDRSISWDAGGFPYRVVAPSAHYGLPSGSYMSMKYPHVHWWFGSPSDRGVHRWARTLLTPSDQGWSTSDVTEAFEVQLVGSQARFRCG